MDTIRIPLLFSDTTLGTQEFGTITRTLDGDPNDDDRRYERHLRRTRPDLRTGDY
jgi:hypothetical protein